MTEDQRIAARVLAGIAAGNSIGTVYSRVVDATGQSRSDVVDAYLRVILFPRMARKHGWKMEGRPQ